MSQNSGRLVGESESALSHVTRDQSCEVSQRLPTSTGLRANKENARVREVLYFQGRHLFAKDHAPKPPRLADCRSCMESRRAARVDRTTSRSGCEQIPLI